MLSSRGDEVAKVAALDQGADDYVTKPFGMEELLARIRAALRHQLQVQGERPIFKLGDLSVDLVRRIVKSGGEEVKLSPKEYELLRLLIQHAGKVLTHKFLLKELWSTSIDPQYLRVYVRQLRNKIEQQYDEAAPTEAATHRRLLASCPPGDVSLELRPAEQDVEVVAGTARFHIRTLRAEDFPPLPEPGRRPDRHHARAGLHGDHRPRRPLGLARRDAPDPHRHPRLGGRRRAAHGGHRLLSPERQGDAPGDLAARRLRGQRAGPRAARSSAAWCATTSSDIRIGVRANQVVFEVDGLALSSRLIDGQFPNYRQLLPEAYEHELTINREELLEVVRRISLMAQKNAPLRLSFSEGEVSISAQTPDVGEASEPVPIPFAGEPFDIGFNPDFLIAGLESAGSEDVVLKLISPLRPGLLESADGSGFLYLIMPIRLNV